MKQFEIPLKSTPIVNDKIKIILKSTPIVNDKIKIVLKSPLVVNDKIKIMLKSPLVVDSSLILIKYGTCKPKTHLCKKDDCYTCYYKSFASNIKSKCWDYHKNIIKPRDVFLKSGKKYWFLCDKCIHSFEKSPNTITTQNTWCKYCSNQDRCLEKTCKLCFENSFESCEKSKHLIDDVNMRTIAKCSSIKYNFMCHECNHIFDKTPASIVGRNEWCPFCAQKKKCDDSCDICFDNSFSTNKKSEYWNYEKNKINPDKISKCSGIKYWFDCPICKHTFDTSPLNISNGSWCPYCSIPTKKICYDPQCNHCSSRSFSSHEKSGCWDYEKNIITPRQILAGTNEKYWFVCNICDHKFEIIIHSIYSNGNWCSKCSKGKREREISDWCISTYKLPKFNQRPTFLCNPKTGFNLELDIWWIDDKIAIEVQGRQHYEFCSRFHSSYDDFEYQIEKDKFKLEQCDLNDIKLLYIKYDDAYWKQTIEHFIGTTLNKLLN